MIGAADFVEDSNYSYTMFGVHILAFMKHVKLQVKPSTYKQKWLIIDRRQEEDTKGESERDTLLALDGMLGG